MLIKKHVIQSFLDQILILIVRRVELCETLQGPNEGSDRILQKRILKAM